MKHSKVIAIIIAVILTSVAVCLSIVVYKGTLSHVPPSNILPTKERYSVSTALCKDGMYSSSISRSGTCSSHGGVKE